MTKLTKRLSNRILIIIAIIYTIIVTVLFLMPAREVPNIQLPISDKLVHIAIFGLLSFIWLKFFLQKERTSLKVIFTTLLLIFSYGIIIEVLQELFFETRKADFWDIVANTIGIFLGTAFYFFLAKKRVLP